VLTPANVMEDTMNESERVDFMDDPIVVAATLDSTTNPNDLTKLPMPVARSMHY